MLRRIIRWVTMRYGRARSLYLFFCRPRAEEFAEFVRRHGGLHSMGHNCRITPTAVIADPALVRLGNNVTLSTCALIGHDGSIAVLNDAFGVKLDSVGPIDIRDNVFVGYQAVIMPGVSIGPNAIVAAGAVVTHDVAEGDIVGGVPAKPIGRVADLVRKLQEKTQALPWGPLIAQRNGPYDPAMEDELNRMRVAYFFGDGRPVSGTMKGNELA